MAVVGACSRGTVTRIDPAGHPWVEIPTYAVGQEFGPCEALTSVAGLTRGTRVLVAAVTPGDFVVVGTLPAGVPGPIPPNDPNTPPAPLP